MPGTSNPVSQTRLFCTVIMLKVCRLPGLPYESDGDAHRKIRIKPLKETNLGVVQALFDPKRDHAKTDNQIRASVILNALKIDAKD